MQKTNYRLYNVCLIDIVTYDMIKKKQNISLQKIFVKNFLLFTVQST